MIFFPLKLSVFLLVHNFCSHNLIISALTTTSRCTGPLVARFLYPLQLLVSSLCVVAPCINCLLTTFEPCPLHHLSYPYPDPDGLGITHHHYSIHLLCITPPMSCFYLFIFLLGLRNFYGICWFQNPTYLSFCSVLISQLW